METLPPTNNPLQLRIDEDQLAQLPLTELTEIQEYLEGQSDRFYLMSCDRSMPKRRDHAELMLELIEVAHNIVDNARDTKIRSYVQFLMPDGADAVDIVIREEGEEYPF